MFFRKRVVNGLGPFFRKRVVKRLGPFFGKSVVDDISRLIPLSISGIGERNVVGIGLFVRLTLVDDSLRSAANGQKQQGKTNY